MLKTIFSAVLPAAITFFSCNPNQNASNTDQESITEQSAELPEDTPTGTSTTDTTMQIDTSATPPDNVRVDETNPNPSRQTQNKKEIEGITVSFISIGEGIDGEAFKAYKAYLDNWSASGKKPTYETIGWGREGETDLCIDMRNVSDADAKKLLAETKQRLKDNTLVQVETNQPCKESRIRK